MPSPQTIAFQNPAGYVRPPPAPIPTIPGFTPVPRPTIPGLTDPGGAPIPRINAAGEQTLLDQFGALDDKYRFNRTHISGNLQRQLEGLNYKFTMNPDGTLSIEDTGELGIRQRQDVRKEQAQGSARGQLYSSFTDQAIGDSLQRLGKFAIEAIGQYGADIKKANDDYLIEASDLGRRLGDYLTDDAKWAVENYVPPPPPPTGGPGSATSAHGEPIIWRGNHMPNMGTLQARTQIPPGYFIDVRKTGSGQWVAVIAKGPVLGPQGWGAAR